MNTRIDWLIFLCSAIGISAAALNLSPATASALLLGYAFGFGTVAVLWLRKVDRDHVPSEELMNKVSKANESAVSAARVMPPTTNLRNKILEWTPAERAIDLAVRAVETAGAHILLTDAVNLLAHARQKVAMWVETAPPELRGTRHHPSHVESDAAPAPRGGETMKGR